MPSPIVIGLVVLVLCVCVAVGIYFATQSASPAPSDSSQPPPTGTPSPTTPPPPSGTQGGGPPTTPVPPPPSTSWQTYPNTECYSSQYDIGYQGVQTAAQIQTSCAANPNCAGAVQHGGGDWWLLSGVHPNNGVGGSAGNQCIVAPGKSLV